MISLPIGAILVAVIFFASMGFKDIGLYFNLHSFVLVGGGTFAVLLFSSPIAALKNLWKEILHLFKTTDDFHRVKTDLVQLAKNKHKEFQAKDELISYAKDLWMQGVAHELFIVLLSQKRKEIEQRSVDAIQCLKNLAKYPPALGMAGTVMGIVTLFQSLDADKSKIGSSLALALTATFFGLAIANGIVMPLADRLHVRHLSQQNYLNNVYQVLLLINQDEASQLIEDEVNLRAA